MAKITVKDGTEIYYKDWGSGQPLVFSHAFPISSDSWDSQMVYFGERGYRVIAYDRRGHGRSSQPWIGNDADTYADDIAELTTSLSLKDVIYVGHSIGGGDVARYLGRHGTKRAAKAVLLGAVPPLMLKTAANPNGLPKSAFDEIRAGVMADARSSLRSLPFRSMDTTGPGVKISDGVRDSFWLQGMMAGQKNLLDEIKAFSETDFTEDLKKIDVPTFIAHGDDDQLVPIIASALLSSKIVEGSTLKIYAGAPHGLNTTHADQFNADLLAFISS